MPKLQFTPNWRASLLAVLLLPVLLSLGLWQLDRAEEKRQLQALFEQRQASGLVGIKSLQLDEDLRYQPVRLAGHFINDKIVLLDNRIHKGQFGYELIMVFELADSEQLVLVNRGWIKGDVSRRSLPQIEEVLGEQILTGEVYVPQGKMLSLGETADTRWPRILQSVNVSDLSAEFKQPLFPYTVRLNVDSPAALQPNWVVVNLQPAKHTGYAVQWFAMSFTVLLILFLANTNCWSLIKQQNNR